MVFWVVATSSLVEQVSCKSGRSHPGRKGVRDNMTLSRAMKLCVYVCAHACVHACVVKSALFFSVLLFAQKPPPTPYNKNDHLPWNLTIQSSPLALESWSGRRYVCVEMWWYVCSIIFYSWGGVSISPFGTVIASGPVKPALDDSDGALGGMRTRRRNGRIWRNTCPIATLHSSPTQSDLELVGGWHSTAWAWHGPYIVTLSTVSQKMRSWLICLLFM
jgi:hypothetical protein